MLYDFFGYICSEQIFGFAELINWDTSFQTCIVKSLLLPLSIFSYSIYLINVFSLQYSSSRILDLTEFVISTTERDR